MQVIRPMRLKDLDSLLQLVLGSGHGLTSLPKDPDILQERLLRCERSFRPGPDAAPEDYIFGLEDLDDNKIFGISGIYPNMNRGQKFCLYEITSESRSSRELGISNTLKMLRLKDTECTASEICSLYLHPEYRKSSFGRFLSLVRFLFIADHLQYFRPQIFAEMRGMVDEQGTNPFWSAVGSKFFNMSFTQADYLYMISKKWIRDLLPDIPICINMLPSKAQFMIGKPHPKTVPALKILEQEGFSDSGLISILSPGPILQADVKDIRSIRDSVVAKVTALSSHLESDEEYIISNQKFENFRAVLDSVARDRWGIVISQQAAQALEVKVGDRVRFISICKKPKETV